MSATKKKNIVYAGVLIRSFAYFIDCIIAFGILVTTQFLLLLPLRNAFGIDKEWFHSGLNTELYTLLTISLPIWLYFTVCEASSWQATVGKRLLRLQVVHAVSNQRIGFARSLLRTSIKLLPWEIAHLSNNLPEPLWYSSEPEFRIGFIAVGILIGGYVFMTSLSKKKQGLHDFAANTVILKNRFVVE